MNSIRKMLRKELTEQKRDKRTLWTTVLTPLIITLGIFLLLDWYMESKVEEVLPKLAVVGTWSSEEKKELEKALQVKVMITEQPAAKVKKGDLVAYIEKPTNRKTYLLHAPQGMASSILLPKLELFAYQKSIKETKLPQSNQWTVKLTPAEGPANLNQGLRIFSLLFGTAPLSGGMSAAIDAIAGEKERRTIQSLLTLPISLKNIWLGKWLSVSIMCLIPTIITIGSMIGVQAIISKPAFDPAILLSVPPVTILAVLLLIVLYCCISAAVLLIISTFVKSFKEAQSYMSALVGIWAFLPLLSLAGKTAEELTWNYFAIPILNFNALFFTLFQNASNLTNFLISIGSNIITLGILIGIGVWLFHKPQLTVAN